MGVRILVGKEQGTRRESAVLFCSTSMWAFGPVMETGDEAETFCEWLAVDPRTLKDHDLERKYSEFSALVRDAKTADLLEDKLEEIIEACRVRVHRISAQFSSRSGIKQ